MGKEFKRMRYFDGLFLKAEDYSLDKEHQRRLQRLHNRYLHTWGIVQGLEVKAVTDSQMEVVVSEGVALDMGEVEDLQTGTKESISREILIYAGHPDNPLDLSEYSAAENIYITVSYEETQADRDMEKGQGEEIHIWERGRISHSKTKPHDPKQNIVLARVVPRTLQKEITNQDGSRTIVNETVIDSSCIIDTDYDGSSLRVYAGASSRVLPLEKLIVEIGEDIEAMPSITISDEESVGNCLEVNALTTKFTGSVDVEENLVLSGELTIKSHNPAQGELLVSNNYLQVNSPTEGREWKARNGGLEVYRGGRGVAPDARVIWSEAEKCWKAGLGNELWHIAYGPLWERLIKNEFADGLHRHDRLYSPKGIALSVDSSGNLAVNGDLTLKDKMIWLKTVGDTSNGLGWFGYGKTFAGVSVNGPALFGLGGGMLGTTSGGEKSVLSWNGYGNVGIGTGNNSGDKLNVDGSFRILSGTNPIRFTSVWTAFPDSTINQAEICNDTTYHKALMIVGNQSSGQGRKVAVWDRLDVNGFLYDNGSLQISQAITLSAGNANNGVIFPKDPGGGSGDGAWLKYYPRSGEACTLEIGTSNDWDDDIAIIPSGSVSIGGNMPNEKLDINGWMRILSESNPLRFTSSWTGFPDISANQAEICNDTNFYKTLMIVGNKSGGQGRKVSIWDRLDVNGFLHVKGNLQASGAIIPSVGNSDYNGIMFPRDSYGGSGDAAWIRYYSDTSRGGGQNMTLEISIANDTNLEYYRQWYWRSYCSWAGGCGYWYYVDRWFYSNNGDRMRFHASGGVYVDGYFYYTSSRERKENITYLCGQSVQEALHSLEPVEFSFKGDSGRTTMGFIAEDTPEIFAAQDKKSISPFEIVTALVSEVKSQEKDIAKLKKQVAAIKRAGKSIS
jgi:hypothetical protein